MSGVRTLGIELRSERGRRTVAVLLIDGVPLLRMLDGYTPLSADEVLGTGALAPVDPPRRVALYECACGGALPPADYDGLDESERRLRALDVPDLAFDAAQYHAEVARVRAAG